MSRPLSRTSPVLALGLLAAISTCGFIDRIIMNVLVQPIKAEFGLTDTQIGLVAGLAFAALNVLLGIWVARYAERGRRVTLVGVGTILWSIATAACGLVTSFVGLVLARVGVGVGEAVGLPATSSLVSDMFPPEKRGRAMAVLLLAPPVGAFLGSAGASVVADAYGWRAAFWLAAAPGFVLSILFLLLVREPQRGMFDKLGDREDAVPPLSAVLHRIVSRRSLRNLLAGSTIASAVGFGANAFLAAYLLRRFGYSLSEAGVIAGLIASVPATTSVLGSGWLVDRLSVKDGRWYGFLPAFSLFLSAPLYIGAAMTGSAALAIGFFATAAIFQYTYLAPTATVFQNMMHPRMRASATAVVSLVYSLVGGGLGPLIVGRLSDVMAPDSSAAGSAIGLSRALAVVALGYVWAGVHYLLATRRIRAELALPI
ncbi:MAG TPA: MFS transporter [Sphingomonadaceae bacterium]|nr:MFS transporter [Sphingomonadaceae bacterium]